VCDGSAKRFGERPRLAGGHHLGHGCGGGAGGVERHQRFAGGPVLHQFDGPEVAQAAHVAHRRVAVGQGGQGRAQHLVAHLAHPVHDPLLLEDPDAGHGAGAGQHVPGVGEAAGVRPVVEGGGDAPGDDHAAQGEVAAVHALGEADQVGRDVPSGLDREPLAAATEAGHDLVGDEHDAVLVAEVAHPGQVAGWRHEDAVGAHHRFQDDGRDGLGTFHHDRVGQVGQRPLGLLGLAGGVEGGAVGVRPPEVDDAGDAGLAGPAAGVAGEVIEPPVAPW
jgi:hypothetical protein